MEPKEALLKSVSAATREFHCRLEMSRPTVKRMQVMLHCCQVYANTEFFVQEAA